MRPLLRSLLGVGLVWVLAAGCTTKDSLLDDPGAASGNGARGGSAAGTSGGKASSAGSSGATSGASSTAGTAGSAGRGSGGTASGGTGAEGGEGDRGGEQGAGTSGQGSGGAGAGTGGTSAAGAAGASSCPEGQMWCPGCTLGSGMCAEGCPASACGPCAMVETLEECEARTDCHSVFQDSLVCGCAGVGCCTQFTRCADGELADCTGANLNCEGATPYCEAPAYVVSHSGICYEGCVDPKDCAPSPPSPCPPSVPADGAACGGDTQCYYDACPEGGRAIATCSGRVWTVETGTSCAVECAGVGQQCEDGQICLVHAGGAISVDCTENGCGTGPILEECAGNCPVFFSLYGGTTATCNTCPEGTCP